MNARVEPIAVAIRRARQALANLEWAGADVRAARAQLQTLLAAQARGEQWSVNF
jgi:flavin-binding protein dodecin